MSVELEDINDHSLASVPGEINAAAPELAPNKYRGEFDNEKMWGLNKEATETRSPQEFFGVLETAAIGQGQHGVAEAIRKLADETKDPSFLRNPDDIVTKANENPQRTAEEILKYGVSLGLGQALKALSEGLSRHGDGDMGTPTLDDVRMDREIDRKSFVILSRILAKDPSSLDGTRPQSNDGTYEKTRVESTVPGMDFVLARHNPRQKRVGLPDDQIKLYLAKRG